MFYYTMNADLSKLLNSLTVGSVAGLFLVAFAVSASGAGMLSNPLDSGDSAPTAEASESASNYAGYVSVEHQRDVDGDGEYETVDTYKGHNQIVDQGLDYFAFQASGENPPTADFDKNDDGTSDGSSTEAANSNKAVYISVSDAQFDGNGNEQTFNNPTATSLNEEIQTGNLSRTGAKADGTISNPETRKSSVTNTDGNLGQYSVEYTFTATQDFTPSSRTDYTGYGIQWTGLHWSGSPGADDLVAANHFPGVTMLADDKLTISWTEVSFDEA
jgi:hypothetical protein